MYYIKLEQLVRPRALIRFFLDEKLQRRVVVHCAGVKEIRIVFIEHWADEIEESDLDIIVEGLANDVDVDYFVKLLRDETPTRLHIDNGNLTQYVGLSSHDDPAERCSATEKYKYDMLRDIDGMALHDFHRTELNIIDSDGAIVVASDARPRLECADADVKKSGAIYAFSNDVVRSASRCNDVTLNGDQMRFVDLVRRSDQKIIFLDSDAGTGKTFVCDALTTEFRSTILVPNHKLRSLRTSNSCTPCLTILAAIKRLAFRGMRVSPKMMRETMRDNLNGVIDRMGKNIMILDQMDCEFNVVGEPAFPELIVVDEAAMTDWREIVIFREIVRLRNGNTRLVLLGDTTQNGPFDAETDNGCRIHDECTDVLFQFDRNMRATDERLVDILRIFHSRYSSSLQLRKVLRVALWRAKRDVFAPENEMIDLTSTVLTWMRGERRAPLMLPRVLALSNVRADKLNYALQRLLWDCAARSNLEAHISKRKIKPRDDGVENIDQPYANAVLLIVGLRYRYVGASLARQNISRDETVVLHEYNAHADEVVVRLESSERLVRIPRVFYEESRMSSDHCGVTFYGFPLQLDFALTQYKAQGDTIPRERDVYIDACGMNDRALYVSLSRMQTLDQLRGIVNV